MKAGHAVLKNLSKYEALAVCYYQYSLINQSINQSVNQHGFL